MRVITVGTFGTVIFTGTDNPCSYQWLEIFDEAALSGGYASVERYVQNVISQ